MTDKRMLHRFSGHTHAGAHETTPVVELDGTLVTVGVDFDGTLWTCNLLGGECAERDLELDTAGPENDWYEQNGVWGWSEGDTDGDEEDERPEIEAEADEIVSELTVAHLKGCPVVITGGSRFDLSHPDLETMGGAVRVWDLRTGRKIGKTLTGHGLGVCSLTSIASEQGLIAVSSSEEGTLLAWNLTRGGEQVRQISGSYNGGMGADLVDGRPVAVTGGHDDFLQAWDLLTGVQIGKNLTGIKPAVRAIAITEVNGRAVVVSGGDDNVLHRWDLTTQEPIEAPMTGHTDSIQTLGTIVVAGRAVAVSGSNDGTTRVWDLAGGRQIGEPIAGHRLQLVTEAAGIPAAVTDSEDGIRMWDLTVATR
ncbi:WD40 repeat domain-containing protein [Streptomyces sp. NPDC054864]